MLNDLPLTGQTLLVTRDPIRNNFSIIDTAFSVNHVQYQDGAGNQGKHAFVQMPSAVPTIATSATEVGLYANADAITGKIAFFFQKQSLAANSGYSFTEYENTLGATDLPSQGWTRLPAGIIVKWGTGVTTANNLAGAVIIDTNLFGPVYTQKIWGAIVNANPAIASIGVANAYSFGAIPANIGKFFVVTSVTFGAPVALSFNYLCWGI